MSAREIMARSSGADNFPLVKLLQAVGRFLPSVLYPRELNLPTAQAKGRAEDAERVAANG
jgi:hypothetical protein